MLIYSFPKSRDRIAADYEILPHAHYCTQMILALCNFVLRNASLTGTQSLSQSIINGYGEPSHIAGGTFDWDFTYHNETLPAPLKPLMRLWKVNELVYIYPDNYVAFFKYGKLQTFARLI